MGRTSDAKERLLRAMSDLMWQNSYGSVTIDMICQEAQVKKGSFYYFFKSKSDLAIAALDKMWGDIKPTLDEIFSPSLPPLERIFRKMDFAYTETVEVKEKYGRVLGCPYVTLASEVSGIEPAILERIRFHLKNYHRYIVSAIREAKAEGLVEVDNPDMAAQCLFHLYEGMLTEARIQNDPEVLRALRPAAFNLLRVTKDASVPTAA